MQIECQSINQTLSNTYSTEDEWCYISEFMTNHVKTTSRRESRRRFHMLSHKQGYKHHEVSVLYVA